MITEHENGYVLYCNEKTGNYHVSSVKDYQANQIGYANNVRIVNVYPKICEAYDMRGTLEKAKKEAESQGS